LYRCIRRFRRNTEVLKIALGGITSTITECAGSAAVKTYLDTQGTGAATAGADISTYQVVSDGTRDGIFWVIKIIRAAE